MFFYGKILVLFGVIVLWLACDKDNSVSILKENSSSDFVFYVVSSGSVDYFSSSSVESSSSYVQKSKVFKDSCIYYSEENRILDLRDSQEYRTVTIGSQIWMAENLNYRYLETGSLQDTTSFCFLNDSANCEKYGRLYMIVAAIDDLGIFEGKVKGYEADNFCETEKPIRGICPQGFHLPSKEEFEELIEFVGGLEQAGKILKSTSGWVTQDNYSDPYEKLVTDSFECSDVYKFCVIPGGLIQRGFLGSLKSVSNTISIADYSDYEYFYTLFWTSTCERNNLGNDFYSLKFDAFKDDVVWNQFYYPSEDETTAYYVRCLKDSGNTF